MAEATSTADEVVAETASTADKVVAGAASTADEVVLESASTDDEVVAAAASTADDVQSIFLPLFSPWSFSAVLRNARSSRNASLSSAASLPRRDPNAAGGDVAGACSRRGCAEISALTSTRERRCVFVDEAVASDRTDRDENGSGSGKVLSVTK